jgi:hypothetical protein
MKEKWLYKFTVDKKETKIKSEKVKDETGKEVTKETSEETIVPHTVAILKPRRKHYEEADLFYGVKLADGIRAGLLTKPQIAKRYNNDGGDLSDDQQEYYAKLLLQKARLLENYQKLIILTEKSEEVENQKKALIENITEIQIEINKFETERSTVFENTAESRAVNQTIMWWIFNLSHISNIKDPKDEDFAPITVGNSFEQKEDSYDNIFDSEDEFLVPVIRRLTFLISLWHNGTITENAQFKELDDIYQKEREEDSEESTEKEEDKKPSRKKKKQEEEKQESNES